MNNHTQTEQIVVSCSNRIWLFSVYNHCVTIVFQWLQAFGISAAMWEVVSFDDSRFKSNRLSKRMGIMPIMSGVVRWTMSRSFWIVAYNLELRVLDLLRRDAFQNSDFVVAIQRQKSTGFDKNLSIFPSLRFRAPPTFSSASKHLTAQAFCRRKIKFCEN